MAHMIHENFIIFKGPHLHLDFMVFKTAAVALKLGNANVQKSLL